MPLTETQIFALIADGESEKVDLKREINLDLAAGKAECIKDITSIANSTKDVGYIFVGVDDNGNIVGITTLEEERIQQIVHSYVNPPLSISCTTVTLSTGTNIGVIEIRGNDKPHKISHSIDKLLQNEVFIRHGSVVMKSSPEKIYRMYNESRVLREQLQFIRSAETFLKLGNWRSALDAYSKAIDLLLTSQLLIERAKIYVELWRTAQRAYRRKLADPYLTAVVRIIEPIDCWANPSPAHAYLRPGRT